MTIRILIAEDDLACRKFMQQILKDYGKCHAVVDGIEAVDAFLSAWEEKNPYDILFLDIMMPKLDGLKAMKIIRDMEKDKKIEPKDHIKIIIITELTDEKTVYRAFDLGCDAFAAKPLNQQEIDNALNKMGINPFDKMNRRSVHAS